MILYGKKEYVPQMKALWKRVFDEEEAYLEAFFKKVHQPENSLVYRVDDIIAAVLYMIPYKMNYGEAQVDITYLYAIATLPEYRGRNFATELIKEARRISESRGCAMVFLVPAEESLFRWYQGLGFEKTFDRIEIHKTREEAVNIAKGCSPLSHNPGDSGQIWELYSGNRFNEGDWVTLSQEQHSFYMEELFRGGGEAWIMDVEEGNRYALLQKEGANLLVHETDLGPEQLPFFLAAIKEKFDFETVIFYQPGCFSPEESKSGTKSFAMSLFIKPMHLNNPYVNRVFM